MKVAIITINDPVNIGNRLQNYAVQEIISKKDATVDTLYYYCQNDNSLRSKVISTIYYIGLKLGLIDSKFFINKIKKNPKMYLVKKFNDENIHYNKKYIFKTRKMQKYCNDYDFFCAGSDQVWNPSLVQNNEFFFMTFSPSKKTFSLSASMGNVYIPSEQKETYIRGFNHVGNISVRENDVKEAIKKLTNRDVEVLLDPTFLIEKEIWISISKKPEFELSENYVVTYFLGDVSDPQKKYIDIFAKKIGCSVINMNGEYSKYIGPSEFLYLINNSKFVFTDSFHGTALSINLGSKFVVFQRNGSMDMSSRITTVLDTFKLSNLFYNDNNNNLSDNFIDYLEDIYDSNYNIDDILNEQRIKANLFINKCLNLGE